MTLWLTLVLMLYRCAAYHQTPLASGWRLLLMMAPCVCGRSAPEGARAPGSWAVSSTVWPGAQTLVFLCWLQLWTHESSCCLQVRLQGNLLTWLLLLSQHRESLPGPCGLDWLAESAKRLVPCALCAVRVHSSFLFHWHAAWALQPASHLVRFRHGGEQTLHLHTMSLIWLTCLCIV